MRRYALAMLLLFAQPAFASGSRLTFESGRGFPGT